MFLCEDLITGSEESYRVCVSNWLWSLNLNNGAVCALVNLLRQRKKEVYNIMATYVCMHERLP